jgi:hypothetical protein
MRSKGWMILISLAMILGGLLMMNWSPGAGSVILTSVVWWGGLAVLILGLLLLLFPVVAWIYKTVCEAFGI